MRFLLPMLFVAALLIGGCGSAGTPGALPERWEYTYKDQVRFADLKEESTSIGPKIYVTAENISGRTIKYLRVTVKCLAYDKKTILGDESDSFSNLKPGEKVRLKFWLEEKTASFIVSEVRVDY